MCCADRRIWQRGKNACDRLKRRVKRPRFDPPTELSQGAFLAYSIPGVYLGYFLEQYNCFLEKNEFRAKRGQKRPVDVGNSCVFDPFVL